MEGTCGKSSGVVGGDSHTDTAPYGMGKSEAKQLKQKAQHRQLTDILHLSLRFTRRLQWLE